MADKVMFVRIRGRVVPIKGKRKKAPQNLKQKIGKGLIPVANIAALATILSKPISRSLFAIGKIQASNTVMSAMHTRSMMRIRNATGDRHFSKKEFDFAKKNN